MNVIQKLRQLVRGTLHRVVRHPNDPSPCIKFGVRPALPLYGFPPGRVRIRQRNTDFAKAFVKTADGIRCFIIAEHEGYWIPYAEQGANHKSNPGADRCPTERENANG